MPKMRLDKLLSHLNCGSRKEVQSFIHAGRVAVNGTAERDPAAKVDPDADRVSLDQTGRFGRAGDDLLLFEFRTDGRIFLQRGENLISDLVVLLFGQTERITFNISCQAYAARRCQTGKTAVALDTILNQKGKNVVCIYVAIGQKSSSVAQLVETLKRRGAMDYTIVVNASASDPASLQYIAPYAGCALGEHFMYQGRDVLIVYDDLSKHAIAYRALSLLLERSPGREAYPGDVFYLHSRLLERSAHLSDALGGGSMTALPIVETQAGDVSAYIPTNVISITDGQIFLESSLFFSGMRPAVNVGLSVSRVGGAAQTKAMKKAAGSIRIDLAQYREMEVFTQFSSDLDPATKAQLTYGSGLMELLKQPLEHPLSMEEQVVILYAATSHLLVDIPKEKLKTFQGGLYEYMRSSYPQVGDALRTTKTLSEDIQREIAKAVGEYKAKFLKAQGNALEAATADAKLDKQ